ncbi:MAG: MFS transporter [Acidobacteria bacterium]|nr:MFS transporter [Acidobacteriota bacterium]
MSSADTPAARLSTRLAFLVAGFGLSCWAPLVPFAKDRLAVDDRVLGALLLCLGIGSVLAMLVTGVLSARLGSRPIIVVSGFGLAAMLPVLALAATPLTLAAALLLFGAALGSLDVAMNIHAVDVERDAPRPLMSGFHALFSIGGFAGAAVITILLSFGTGAVESAAAASVLMVLAMAAARPRLLRATGTAGDAPLFVRPRGIVLLLAGLAAVTFLVEGALLDWSALLITGAGFVEVARGGVGYMLFAIAMTAGRLVGDALTARLGDGPTLLWGSGLAIAGFVVLLAVPVVPVALTGFVLIGLGAANIVPILFRHAGRQTSMPAGLAIAAVTTTGYAGVLVGPAAMGFVADAYGLEPAFWMLAALLCVVPLSSGWIVTAPTSRSRDGESRRPSREITRER